MVSHLTSLLCENSDDGQKVGYLPDCIGVYGDELSAAGYYYWSASPLVVSEFPLSLIMFSKLKASIVTFH